MNQIDVLLDLPFGSDEGRAMMQIIHDVAPGASLAYHTAFLGTANFAQGILRLHEEANADVIVDDIGILTDPFFQDGLVAQAVNTVRDQGVAYFSAAGNDAANSYETPFVRGQFLTPAEIMDDPDNGLVFIPGFANAINPQQPVSIAPNGLFQLSMQWDESYFSVSGVGSRNEMDVYLLNEDGDTVLAQSNTSNFGGDPVEFLTYINDTDDTNFNILIIKRTLGVSSTFNSGQVDVAIPDNGTATSTLNVAGTTGVITDVNVGVNILHQSDADLTVTLTSPTGTAVELFAGVGGTGNNFLGTILDDQASTPIASGAPPFSGLFQPSGALTDFNAENAAGDWTLTVIDGDGNAEIGTLVDWSIQLTTDMDSTPDPGLVKYIGFGGTVVGGRSTIFGHPNADGAFAVAASPYISSPRFSPDPVQLESFTSLGGTPILFDEDGGRLLSPDVRMKPEITGPDGTNTTFFPFASPFNDEEGDGFPNFFGTSAAAPHVAAVAALMLQVVPQATPDDIFDAMEMTALDIISPGILQVDDIGFDFLSGYGLIQADAALAFLSLNARGEIAGIKFLDLNGNGQRDEGEPGAGDFTVFIDHNRDGTFNNDPANPLRQTFQSNVVPLPIPDGELDPVTQTVTPGTITSQVVIGALAVDLLGIEVNLDILTHTSTGQLTASLISPEGTRVELVTSAGASGNNFLGTTFADDDAGPISAGSSPFTGRFFPVDSLNQLAGDDLAGVWTLEVSDNEQLNIGQIREWSITAVFNEIGTTTASDGSFRFPGLPPGPYSVGELVTQNFEQTTPVLQGTSPVLVTEVDMASPDGFEIQNVTDSAVDTTGWNLVISDSPFGNINDVNSNVFPLPDTLAAQEVFFLTDSPADHFFGTNIFWNKSNSRIGSGWVMILNDQNTVVDWMGWGWTNEDIAAFDVTVPSLGATVTGLEGLWSGPGTERTGVGTLQRIGNADTNTAVDFQWTAATTLSGPNANIVLPMNGETPRTFEPVLLRGNQIIDTLEFGNEFVGPFPQALYNVPNESTLGPVEFLDVGFSESMDTTSFNLLADLVSFVGPGGVDLSATIIDTEWFNANTVLRFFFAAPQSDVGDYALTIGSQIFADDDGFPLDQDNDGTPGELNGDDNYTATYSIGAGPDAFPRVVDQSPSGDVVGPLGMIDFEFNKEMDPSSFSLLDDVVSFVGPSGSLLNMLTGFEWRDANTTLRVLFDDQNDLGIYTLIIGPNILAAEDLMGMDQDEDSLPGEAVEDRYTAIVNMTSTIAPVTSGVTQEGGLVSVSGTAEADAFTVDLGGELIVLSINGVEYTFAHSEVDTIEFDGAAGSDSVMVLGSADDESAEIRHHSGSFQSTALAIDVSDSESIYFNARGGQNTVVMKDSSGDDVLDISASLTRFTGSDFSNVARNFQQIRGFATVGNDRAVIDDSMSDDSLISKSNWTQMTGGGRVKFVSGFDMVRAYAGVGNDSAVFYDSTGDDSLVIKSTWAKLSGDGFFNYAKGFESVSAYAGAGNDVAEFYDTPGDDTLISKSTWSRLTGSGKTYYAKNFDHLRAYAGAGNDQAFFYDGTSDDLFTADPYQSQLLGVGYHNLARKFETVTAYAGGGNNTATLSGSSGIDQLTSGAQLATLSGAGYAVSVKSFDQVDVDALAGVDAAVVSDSPADDHFQALGNTATLESIDWGFAYLLANFDQITASASSGNNTRDVDAVDFALEFEGAWTDI